MEPKKHSSSLCPGGQWGPSDADRGHGLTQTLSVLKEQQKYPSRLEAEQIDALITGKFYEHNEKPIIINSHEYFMAGVALI